MKKNTIVKDGIPTIQVSSPSDLSGYLLIDVRTTEEFSGELGHIEGARLVTLGEELDDFLKKEDKNQSIVFICRSGMRSGKATREALSLGYKEVLNMEGGMIHWNKSGFPIKL